MLPVVESQLLAPTRLEALHRTALMGTPAEEPFDRLTRLAAGALGAPLAVLALVGAEEHFVKSGFGLPAPLPPSPALRAFGRRVVASGAPLAVESTAAHVADPGALRLAAYLGVPVRLTTGEVVGVLAVADHAERAWSDSDRAALDDLAAAAVAEIEWRMERDGTNPRPPAELHFPSIVERSSDLIVVLSAGGVVLYESPSVARVLGAPSEERLGKSVWSLLHPHEAAEVIERFRIACEGGDLGPPREIRLRLHDGSWGTFEARVDNQLDDPAVRGVVVTAHDLTRRREAEEHRTRLAAILTASPDVVATLDPNGRALYLNPAGQALLGVEESAVDHANIPDFYPPEETERLLSEVIPTAIREGMWSGETLLLSATGEEIPVEQVVLAHRSAHGETEFLSVIARDVREQKRAAEALRESEERFRCVVHSLDEGLIITDLDDRVLYANERLATMTGYGAEELLGRLAVEVLQIDDGDTAAMEERNRRRREGLTERYQIVMKRSDGVSIPVEVTGTPFLAPSGEIVGTLGALTDITERKELEEQLVQSQKMEAVGRLAGGVAHDFNNLLTAIKGFTELLLLDFDESDPRRSFITEIQGASNRAAGLTRQLLAFSRKQVLQPRVLDLNASVTEIEKMLRRLIGEDVELLSRPEAALGRVKADPGQVEQVLMNLVVNARDAMPEGGRLTLSTANATLTEAEIPPHAEDVAPGRFVVLSVQDTGTGMDEQTKARIFEPFFTTKVQGKGTGLGLATVYGIVQQSGGFVEVESELGVGTTFRIALPRVEEQAEEKPEQRPATGSVSGTETVLLVEDEVAVRVLVRRVLDRAGYRIVEASSGQAALDLLAETGARVDLLLTDVVMPGMSGRELADELTARTPGLPVLYMSGYTDEAIMHHGVLAEGVAFLEKPFTPEILLRKLRDVLDGAPI